MCEISDKLKFCTCVQAEVVDDKRINLDFTTFLKQQSSGPEGSFVWVLYGHYGTESTIALGFMIVPVNSVGLLTENFVLTQLNTEYCFDFDYEPSVGDNLQVFSTGKDRSGGYLSFIYQDGTWIAGYHGVNEIVKLKNYGSAQVEL